MFWNPLIHGNTYFQASRGVNGYDRAKREEEMGLLVGVLALVLTLTLFIVAGLRCSPRKSVSCDIDSAAGEGTFVDKDRAVSVDSMKSMNRSTMRALLRKLADTPAPKVEVICALCYAIADPPHRADYVCPSCGERTLYDDGEKKWYQILGKQRYAEEVECGIPACRCEFQELQKLAGDKITFDESQFCRKCCPDIQEPKLVLHVNYTGDEPHDVVDIDADDISLIRDFLEGKLVHGGLDKIPLKERLPRLQELLGVTLDE